MIQKITIEIDPTRVYAHVVVDERIVATIGIGVGDKLWFSPSDIAGGDTLRVDVLAHEPPAAQYVCATTAKWVVDEYARILRDVLITGRLAPSDNSRAHLLRVMAMQCAEFAGHGAAFVELLAHFLETMPAPKWDETSMKVVVGDKTFDEDELSRMNIPLPEIDP